MLVKSRRVLERRQEDEGVILFDNDDGEGETSDLTQLYWPKSDWEAFGSPEQVTVTIEPGDLLNGEQADEIDCYQPDEVLSAAHPRNGHYLPGKAGRLAGS